MVPASYEITLIVAKNKKPYTIEELIMPAARVLVKQVIGDEVALKLSSVSLTLIQRRITKMFSDINEQVLLEVQSSSYESATRLDETTDASNCALLLVFMCYATTDSIRSKLLLSNEPRTITRGEHEFELVDNFFKNGFQWSKLVGCTTDGTPSTLD